MAHVKRKDSVVVLAGKDRGKRGDVREVDVRSGRVLVAKLNLVKRHTRSTQTDPGGIKEKEASLPLSQVMLVCPKCAQPTRAKYGVLSDGTKSRVCRRCNEMIG